MATKNDAPAQLASAQTIELTARVLDGMAAVLRAVAEHLHTGVPLQADPAAEAEMFEQLQDVARGTGAERCTTALRTQWSLLQALRGLLVPDEEIHLSCKRTDLRRYITPDEWR